MRIGGAVLALALLHPADAGAKRAPDAGAPAPSLGAIAAALDSARALAEGDRTAALERAQQSIDAAMGANGTEQHAAGRFLSGRVLMALGKPGEAANAFRDAADEAAKGPFGDDAAFAAVEALEVQGRDEEAAREWSRWEKRWPESPLRPAARLAEAWNALRRGATPDALRQLDALVLTSPWMSREPRFQLARATALQLSGKPDAALAQLADRPADAAGTYVKALALQAQGQRLRAAAAFQDVADRWPASPLRDLARLAKANTFLAARDWRSASEEFARVAAKVDDPAVRAEAELRGAGAVFLAGNADSALALLRGVVERNAGSDVAARAQFLVGEALASRDRSADAIVEYNRVLTIYFQHKVAASAQYRVARCLDRLGRHADATGSYQAVVAGYPLEPEAPAAAYLAGVGLLGQNRPIAAAKFFQIVLDRYAGLRDPQGHVVFAAPEHQEIVEAALCLLLESYRRAGDLGQLSGAPHLLLARMPASHSTWRAWALLIDADATSAQGRYDEARAELQSLARDFPDHPAQPGAMQLLAWVYAKQGQDSLAVATEEQLLTRHGAASGDAIVSGAMLDIGHVRFNQKRFRDAAAAYEDFLHRWPHHPKRLLALYQAGLCYLRLDRAGDAVDRWETLVRDSADAPLAERAWARAGDAYFQAEKYADARRCYDGLLAHFADGAGSALASLRLAQCAYNSGDDAAALTAYSNTIASYPDSPMAKEAARGQEMALYRLSQRPDGAKVLGRLVEEHPTSPFAADALFQIAKRAYQAKRWGEAADGFRQVVSRFPGWSSADQAQFLLADSWSQAGVRAEARGAYEQFLSYFPTSTLAPAARFRLGLIEFEEKDYGPAAVSFTQVLDDSAARDVRAASRYNLALCKRLTGDLEGARAELERYRADFPGDSRADDVAFQLGDLDEAAGNMGEAAKEFERALDANPGGNLSVEIAMRLGRCREQLGNREGAIAAYQVASRAPGRNQPFRLSAVARLAALYEAKRDVPHALAAYRDIVQNAQDKELVAAAAGRVSQLEASQRRR
jgi:TolA-binding protein